MAVSGKLILNFFEMSRNYKFRNPEGVFFVSFAVVEWIDVFTRNKYKNILVDSLEYCQREKGMELFAWCIMTNHVHLIFRDKNGKSPESILGDFKRFTSKAIVKSIKNNPSESRKEWLLDQFEKAANKSSNVNRHQFWRHDNHPIELWSTKIIIQKLNYLHRNPVAAGLVYKAEDYVYSSAASYAGNQGLLDVNLIEMYY